MKLETLVSKIKKFHAVSGVPYVPQTSVVSPLFPGNYNYCLDESNVFKKYGNLLPNKEESFHKIQPAIRLSDYDVFIKDFKNESHLGTFSITTVTGFSSFKIEQSEKRYRASIRSFLSFIESLGLDRKRLKISYFSGNDAKGVEESRKHDRQEIDRKIRFDAYIPKDPLRRVLVEEGLTEQQLVANKSRDNFLTSAWYVTEAPWGYRNEIFYRLPNDNLLDIATIERLFLVPTVVTEKDSLGQEAHFVTGIKPWDMTIIVDGFGIERLLMAIEGKSKIWDIEIFKPLRATGVASQEIERIRIAQRILTDCPKKELGSRHRKRKLNEILRGISHLTIEQVKSVLVINAMIYQSLYPELLDSVPRVLDEIKSFRK
jgi:alanyl-tRNA synthetase